MLGMLIAEPSILRLFLGPARGTTDGFRLDLWGLKADGSPSALALLR